MTRSYIDAPSVMIGRDVGIRLTLVTIEIGERACLLLDDLNANAPIIFDMPLELVTVVNTEFTPNSSRDVRLIP